MHLILTIIIIATLGPILGSLFGVLKKPSKRFTFEMLSFAAGVMLAISFLELIPESIEYSSIFLCVLGLIIGIIIMHVVDKLIPHIHPEFCTDNGKCDHLKKAAILLIAGISIHNFPEGMAMAIGSVSEIKLSMVIALAIAIHDIPEAICTSYPYYCCTGKRLKAFLISSSTAIPTIMGFLFAYFLFQNISQTFVGLIIGATAGLMIYISTSELIPNSCFQITNHCTIFSFILGVILVILLGYL